VVGLLVILGFPLLIVTLTTVLWSRRAWKRGQRLTRSALVAAWLSVIAVSIGLLGLLVSVITTLQTPSRDGVDPSQKARILGECISAAWNWTAFTLVIWIPATIALHALTRGKLVRREAASTPTSEDPPGA
jgi:hypothetical protein